MKTTLFRKQLITQLLVAAVLLIAIAISGITSSAAEGVACTVCGEADCINCTHLDPEGSHQHDNVSGECTVCGYVPLFKIYDADYNETYTDDTSITVTDGEVYLLKDSETKCNIELRNSELNLNFYTLNADIGVYDYGLIYTWYPLSGKLDGTVSNWDGELHIVDCVLSESTWIANASESSFAHLEGVTVENPEFDHPFNVVGSIKVQNGYFPSGFKLFTPISGLLYDGGLVLNESGEEITLADGQTELSDPVTVLKYFAKVSVEGEEDAYFSDFEMLSTYVTSFEKSTVTLLSDVNCAMTEDFEVKDGAHVILDLAGKSVSNVYIWVYTDSKLTVTDSSEDETGIINKVHASTVGYCEGGELVLEKGNFHFSTIIRQGGKMVCTGGKYEDSNFMLDNGSFEITGGSFSGDAFISGLDRDNTSALISGGSFSKLNADASLSGVFADDHVLVTEDGKYITDFSVNAISEPFNVVAHSHEYNLTFDENYHWYECVCGTYDPDGEKEAHNGGAPTCEDPGSCIVCNYAYQEAIGHNFSIYSPIGNGMHRVSCTNNDPPHYYDESCTANTEGLACGATIHCMFCEGEMGKVAHDFGEDYVFDNGTHHKVCQRADCGASGNPLPCTPGDEPTCTDPKVCLGCGGVLEEAHGHDELTPATCTDGAVCSICSESYTEPLGHEYEHGVCKICGYIMPVKAIFDTYDVVYFENLEHALDAMIYVLYGYETLEITLLDDVTVAPETNLMTCGGKITLDLAGYTVTDLFIVNIGAHLVIKDSSELQTGKIIAPADNDFISNHYGKVTLESGSYVGNVTNISAQGDAELEIHGGTLTGNIALMASTLEIKGGTLNETVLHILSGGISNCALRIYGGTFKKPEVFSEAEELTLADAFGSIACVYYVDKDGKVILPDFSANYYNGTFTAVHDEGHIKTDSYERDSFYHWNECANGVINELEAHTFASGTVCTVCGESAPFIVTVGESSYGFAEIGAALSYLVKADGAKLTLYANCTALNATYSEIFLRGKNVSIDLNGFSLDYNRRFNLEDGAMLTVFDGSEGRTGSTYGMSIDVMDGLLVLRDILTEGYLILKLESENAIAYLDGVVADGGIDLELYNGIFSVKEAEINGMSVNGATLDTLFNKICIELTDEDGQKFSFDDLANTYAEKFKVVHLEEAVVDGHYVTNGAGIHWMACHNCNHVEEPTRCSGGEASCTSGAICSDCGNVYTEAHGHNASNDGMYCTECGIRANFRVETGDTVRYFITSPEAFKYAEAFDNAVITVVGSVNDVTAEDVILNKSTVILDLNGQLLAISDLNIYGGTLIIRDSGGNGALMSRSNIDVYSGAIIIESGSIIDSKIDLDPEDGEVQLIIRGGYFDQLKIDSDDESHIITLDISGGVFYDLELDLDYYMILSITGGEFHGLYSKGNEYYELVYVFVEGECRSLITLDGREFGIHPSLNEVEEPFKVVHKTVDIENARPIYTATHHWYVCDCESLISAMEPHTGGTATCTERAECEVCEAEYGSLGSHHYDENFVCTVCEQSAEPVIQVSADGIDAYFDDFEKAFNYLQMLDDATIILLSDVAYDESIRFYNMVVSIDLNGHKLDTEGIYAYKSNVSIIDAVGGGELFVTESIGAESSSLTVWGGSFGNITVELSQNEGKTELYLIGGSFGVLDLYADTYNVDMVDVPLLIDIRGGEYDTIAMMIGKGVSAKLSGGTSKNGIYIVDFEGDLGIGDILAAECYSFYNEEGKKMILPANKKGIFSYVEIRHTDSYTLRTNEDNHWYECHCGIINGIEPHSYLNDCDIDCDVCLTHRTPADHVYSASCDTDCNVCAEEREAMPHSYSDNCDNECNSCAAARTPSEHVYESSCDTDCDECGSVRVTEHHFGDTEVVTPAKVDAAGEGKITCTVCGATESVTIPMKGGLPTGATVAITAGSTLVATSGIFSLIWFVIKRKSLAELLSIFAK